MPDSNSKPEAFDPRWDIARGQVRRQVSAYAAGGTTEIGTPGTWITSGRVLGVEHNKALSSDKALGTGITSGIWERMEREDPQIAAMLRSIRSVLLATPISVVEPVDGDETDERIADEVRQDFDELEGGFKGWLRQALTFAPRGFSAFEVVYRRRADGRIGIRKFAPRLQRTVMGWHLGKGDELAEVEFDAPFGGDKNSTYRIDAAKLLLMSLDREGNNFEGVSLLRPCYTDWLLKRQVLRATSIDIERAGHGYMRFKQTERSSVATDADKAAFHQTALNWRTNEFAHSIEPFGWEMELIFPDIPLDQRVGFLRYLDQQIAKAFLATFLELGLDKAGTQALGGTLVEHFMLALRSILDVVEEAINAPGGISVNGPIRRVVEWNHGPRETYPQFKFGDVNPDAARESLTAIVEGSGAGVFGEFSEADFAHNRQLAGMPELSADASVDETPAAPTPEAEPEPEAEPATVEDEGPEPEAAAEDDETPDAFAVRPGTGVEQVDGTGARFECHRVLLPDEQVVAFSAINALIVAGLGRYRSAVEKILLRIGAALAGNVRSVVFDTGLDAAAKIEAMGSLGIAPDDLTQLRSAIEKHLGGVARESESLARAEITRQVARGVVAKVSTGGTTASVALADIDLPDMGDVLKARSAIAASRLVGEIADSVQAAGLRAATLGPEGAARALLDVDGAVSGRAEGFYRKHAAQVVQPTVTDGRAKGSIDGLKAAGKDNVESVLYSSVLDGNTCSPCRSRDGQDFAYGSARFHEWMPPLQYCDGRGNCRCLFILVGS